MQTAVQSAHEAYRAAYELAPERPAPRVIDVAARPVEDEDVLFIPKDWLIAIAGALVAMAAGGMAGSWLQL